MRYSHARREKALTSGGFASTMDGDGSKAERKRSTTGSPAREDRPRAERRSRKGQSEGSFGAGWLNIEVGRPVFRVKENEVWFSYE